MPEINREYIKSIESLYSPSATSDRKALRRKNFHKPDIRTEFSRDSDRIIHSQAFARYIDKTQVFYLVNNDHITHRSLHVQIVSKIARTIGRALHLNEDLIEAISLGHDIGHPPYGHTGEKMLSDLCLKHGKKRFMHNIQSVRFLDKIEDADLTIQVLDGILCHNGEITERCLRPCECNDWEDFEKRTAVIQDEGQNILPMTAEGCVVRLSDTIAYIGRDIQDAREVGLIGDDILLPDNVSELLGDSNRDIVNSLIMDILKNSDIDSEGMISYSRDVFSALECLKKFNYKNIYENPILTVQKGKIEKMYSLLYEHYLDDLNNDNMKSLIYSDLINKIPVKSKENYNSQESLESKVCDYIAGMTDNYFEKRFCDLVLPKKTEGRFA